MAFFTNTDSWIDTCAHPKHLIFMTENYKLMPCHFLTDKLTTAWAVSELSPVFQPTKRTFGLLGCLFECQSSIDTSDNSHNNLHILLFSKEYMLIEK